MVDKFYFELGQNFCRARRERGITQEQAARAIDRTGSTVSFIESGRHRPSVKMFVQLCALYGLDPTRVLAGTVGLETATGKKPNSSN